MWNNRIDLKHKTKFLKRKVTIKIFFIGLSLFYAMSGYSQHNKITSVLTKVMEYYSARPVLSFDMTYTMFESYKSDKVIQQTAGMYKINNQQIYIQLGGQVQLLNKNYAIVMDDISQTMVVKQRLSNLTQKTPMGLDSLINMFAETKVSKETENLITISFARPKATFYAVNSFNVDIEKSTGKIIGAILFYAFDLNDFYEDYNNATIPRIEIKYNNYVESGVDESFFNESNYFTKQGDKMIPTKKYTSYRLIN